MTSKCAVVFCGTGGVIARRMKVSPQEVLATIKLPPRRYGDKLSRILMPTAGKAIQKRIEDYFRRAKPASDRVRTASIEKHSRALCNRAQSEVGAQVRNQRADRLTHRTIDPPNLPQMPLYLRKAALDMYGWPLS